jgi:hypothetical protein
MEKNMLKRYILNILIAADQFVNTLAGGDPDETISSRVGKREDGNERFWAKAIDHLFFWDKNHTAKSVETDEGKDAVIK